MELTLQIGWIILILLIQSYSGKSLQQPHSHRAIERGLELMTSLPESNFSNVVVLLNDDVTGGDNDDAWVDKEQILKLKTPSDVKISVGSIALNNPEAGSRVRAALGQRHDASQSTLFIIAVDVDVASMLLNNLSKMDFSRNSWLFIFCFGWSDLHLQYSLAHQKRF